MPCRVWVGETVDVIATDGGVNSESNKKIRNGCGQISVVKTSLFGLNFPIVGGSTCQMSDQAANVVGADVRTDRQSAAAPPARAATEPTST
jgi:hypothetical protein